MPTTRQPTDVRTSWRRRIRRTVAACRTLVHSKAACGRRTRAAAPRQPTPAPRPPLMICRTSCCCSAVVNMCRPRISMFVATRLLFHGFSELGGPKYSGAAHAHNSIHASISPRSTHPSWTSAVLHTAQTGPARHQRSPTPASREAQHTKHMTNRNTAG